jgi:hypothetical protein
VEIHCQLMEVYGPRDILGTGGNICSAFDNGLADVGNKQ